MSKENETRFFAAQKDSDGVPGHLSSDPAPDDVIGFAKDLGFEFSEAELRSVMKELVYGAHSLPRNWGWPLARKLGLVHKT